MLAGTGFLSTAVQPDHPALVVQICLSGSGHNVDQMPTWSTCASMTDAAVPAVRG